MGSVHKARARAVQVMMLSKNRHEQRRVFSTVQAEQHDVAQHCQKMWQNILPSKADRRVDLACNAPCWARKLATNITRSFR